MAPDPEQTKKAQQALGRIAREWMSRPGVVSVEVARHWKDGRPTDEVAIRVTVKRKRPRSDVPDGELFPASLDDIPVDVVEGLPPQLEAL